MKRAALALLLAACAAPSPEALDLDEHPEELTAAPAPGPNAITLTPADETLRTALVAADQAWEAAGVSPERLVVAAASPEGSSRWTAAETVAETCGYPGEAIDACTGHKTMRILVRPEMSDGRLSVVLLHEMGHLIAGRGRGHLGEPCPEDRPGEDVMCSHGSSVGKLTARDVAFVAR